MAAARAMAGTFPPASAAEPGDIPAASGVEIAAVSGRPLSERAVGCARHKPGRAEARSSSTGWAAAAPAIAIRVAEAPAGVASLVAVYVAASLTLARTAPIASVGDGLLVGGISPGPAPSPPAVEPAAWEAGGG